MIITPATKRYRKAFGLVTLSQSSDTQEIDMNTKKRFPVLLNVDISQTENSVEIEADITGFKTQNINVSTWQNSLVIEMTR